MGNPPPLSVDPEQLAAAGNELKYSASQLPAAPAPFGVVGSDPLTQAIDLQIPAGGVNLTFQSGSIKKPQ